MRKNSYKVLLTDSDLFVAALAQSERFQFWYRRDLESCWAHDGPLRHCGGIYGRVDQD